MAEQPIGMIASVVEVVKGLTLTNVLMILLLVIGLAPAYLAWRIINDEELRSIVFSSFKVIPLSDMDCLLRKANEVGAVDTWFISHNFAFAGHDRWYVGVNILTEPDKEELAAYCETLARLIIYSRDRTIPKPDFPHGTGPTIEIQP